MIRRKQKYLYVYKSKTSESWTQIRKEAYWDLLPNTCSVISQITEYGEIIKEYLVTRKERRLICKIKYERKENRNAKQLCLSL